jgi:predicted Zn-dependent protease
LIKDSSNQKVFVLGGYGKDDLRKIKDDRTYISTIFSFDYMTLNDYRKAKPLKIKIIEADQQTTMESLAAASPIGLDALDELRLLNGLYPATEPRSGQLLKIIE